MKIGCLVATAIFALFGCLQFNDMDQYGTSFWLGWVIFYEIIAAVSLVSAFRPFPRAIYGGAFLLCLLASVYRALSIEWDKGVFFNEANPAGNESGGLLMVAIWFLILAVKTPKLPD